ncbi:MAG: 2OG-Fe(II) oxygenase [Bacteroidia bacterium]
MYKKHELEMWLSWMDELSCNNYVVIDDFIGGNLQHDIKSFFHKNDALFTKAGIGALNKHTIRHDIRGDYTFWLEQEKDQWLSEFWQIAEHAVQMFNRYCFLGLAGSEFHLAKYPPGAFYKKHLDQFKNRNNRVITWVIYLNHNWQKGDGGELELFLKNGETKLIDPLAARCIMFMSANIPHRVLLSNKNRFSLTGWLLKHPAPVGKFIEY